MVIGGRSAASQIGFGRVTPRNTVAFEHSTGLLEYNLPWATSVLDDHPSWAITMLGSSYGTCITVMNQQLAISKWLFEPD